MTTDRVLPGSVAVAPDRPALDPIAAVMARKRVILSALALATLLSSLDNTIVSTAMPTVVGSLGGFSRFTWVTTAYAVSSAISTLLLGKLGDLYGRRKLLLFTIATFLIGSILCGGAQTMNQLIAFRAIQGIGGGGIWSLSFAVVSEIVPPRDRGRYFGLFTGVFAVSGVAGPIVGGFMVDHVAWRWIFYMNLPLGLISLAVVYTVVRLPFTRKNASFDLLGAVLVSLSVGALLVAIEQGGHQGWTHPPILAMFLLSAVMLVVFISHERRVENALIPLSVFREPVFRVACLLGLVLGTTMMSAGLFFSIFFQDARFVSPTGAGVRNFPLLLSMATMSIVAGRSISRLGSYRLLPRVGSALLCVGYVLGLFISSHSPYVIMAVVLGLAGLGMGMSMPAVNIAAQNRATLDNLGIITSVANFTRSMGGSIGLAIMGAVFNSGLRAGLNDRMGAGSGDGLSKLIRTPAKIRQLPPATRTAIADSIIDGMGRVFIVSLVFAAIAFVLSFALKHEPLRTESLLEAAPAE